MGENFITNQQNESRKIQPKYIWWRLKLFFACKLKLYWMFLINIAWKVSVFGIFLVLTFPHFRLNTERLNAGWMRENTDQKNSEYGYFTRSGIFKNFWTVIAQVPSVKLHQNHVFFFSAERFYQKNETGLYYKSHSLLFW